MARLHGSRLRLATKIAKRAKSLLPAISSVAGDICEECQLAADGTRVNYGKMCSSNVLKEALDRCVTLRRATSFSEAISIKNQLTRGVFSFVGSSFFASVENEGRSRTTGTSEPSS